MPELELDEPESAAMPQADDETDGRGACRLPVLEAEARRRFVALLLSIPDVGRDEDFARMEFSSRSDRVSDRYQRH